MFGLGRSKKADVPGTKIPVATREARLEARVKSLEAQLEDLGGRYAALYTLNQNQARMIDELRGANEIFEAVG